MPHFMIVLIFYVNLLNLSLIKKCLFLRNMKPLECIHSPERERIFLKILLLKNFSRWPASVAELDAPWTGDKEVTF